MAVQKEASHPNADATPLHSGIAIVRGALGRPLQDQRAGGGFPAVQSIRNNLPESKQKSPLNV